jgi:anti-anti-sigma factor
VEAPIEVSRSDSETAVVVLRGEHDLSSRPELEGTLQALVRSGSRVVVDISQAEFIDSSILTALFASHRLAAEQGSCLVLQLGTAPIVKRVLEISGVLEVLPCAPTREHAVELAWRNRNGDSS